jgi:hypothetical protein
MTGYARNSIWQRRTRLQLGCTGRISQQQTKNIVDKQVSDLDRLEKTAQAAEEILDDAREATKKKLSYCPKCKQFNNQQAIENVFKANTDIRGYVTTKLNVAQSLVTLKAHQQFIDIVLSEIGQVDPDLRQRIISRLARRQLSIPSLDSPRPRPGS